MTARPLRLATYNVEWFNALFDNNGRMLTDREPSTRYKTTRGEQLPALGIVFTGVQAYEYIHAPFAFKNTNGGTIYGSTFFMATGFHGFHVLVGTIFLIVCYLRAVKGDFTPKQHFGS